MALQIRSSPSDPNDAERIRQNLNDAITSAIEGAQVNVTAVSPGHYEIQVSSASFEGQTRVRQQQRVYAAIAHLMKGDSAPVHAIDRLQTLVTPA
ncbi:BolA family transcriptional regulator [Myxococcota bacterium]|nr:BolA family transcriptional regulator [Myxococcota bacterium]